MNSKLINAVVLAGTMSLTACASIFTGTSQEINVTTDPSGAACQVQRKNEVIGFIDSTPGAVTVDKSMSDITIVCAKQGYANMGSTADSSFQPVTLANIILGGVIGIIVDASTGAMGKYPTQVFIKLNPIPSQTMQYRQ